MQPRIQYAKTPDGVSIAYWTMGSGPPLIHMPPLVWSHIQLELENDEWRGWHEALSRHRTLVRYDLPGAGLSDRERTDFSLKRQVADLHALVEHLGTDKVSLFAPVDSGPAAIQYAVEHPDRLSRLLLYCSYGGRGQHGRGSDQGFKGGSDLLDQNWKVYTETLMHVYFGWDSPEQARWWAEYLRESITWEAYKVLTAGRQQWDASADLARIASPTLVIHRRGIPSPDVSAARTLAAKIPNAQLSLMEGSNSMPFIGDMDGLVRVINEFLDDGPATSAATPDQPGAVHTILFTDIEGSTAMTQRLGDAKARELLREHERMTREALKEHGGSEVKTMGDGFMTSFGSATKALECAIAMQRAFGEHNESANEPIKVRIGLNAGEPIAEDQDLFGTTVNMAARVCAKADGGQILAPVVVRELVAGKGFLLSDIGETELRGFEDPVRLYEVRWREDG
jgi:class 3 adenylate cyclase